MKLTVKETAVFGMLGAVMYASKAMMEVLPNIHLLGAMMVAITVVYRAKALFPIYVYVLLDGLIHGFAMWWIPYLYIWALLWGAVMLLPRRMPTKVRPVVYAAVSAAHGFLFGILYAPGQALLFFNMNWYRTWRWIIVGFPYDIIHGVSNLLCGVLICPMIVLLHRAERYTSNS